MLTLTFFDFNFIIAQISDLPRGTETREKHPRFIMNRGRVYFAFRALYLDGAEISTSLPVARSFL